MPTKHGHGRNAANPQNVVEPTGLRLVTSPLPVHPILARLLTWTDAEVTLAAERIKLGGRPRAVEIYEGKIITLESAIEARALESLGRNFDPVPVLVPDPVEYVLRTIPPQRSVLLRAVAVVRARDLYEADSKKRMSDGGKRGAAKRHGKPVELDSRPQGDDSSGYADWIAKAAKIVDVACAIIKALNGIHKRAPELFDLIASGEITHLADAVEALKRYPDSPEKRLGVWSYFSDQRNEGNAPKFRKAGNTAYRLVEVIPMYERSERQKAQDAKEAHRDPKPEKPCRDIIRGDGFTLRRGDSDEIMARLDKGCADVVYADIEYGKLDHAKSVANIARHVLVPTGTLVVVNGFLRNYDMQRTVMDVGGFMDGPTMFAVYTSPKPARKVYPVRINDGCPIFTFTKGERASKIDHMVFPSEPAERLQHLWQKPVGLMVDLLKALVPMRPGAPKPTIIDPCMGWGTTGVACMRLGWNFIGIEKDPERFAFAAKEIEKARRARR
jgi:DNA modification methylase